MTTKGSRRLQEWISKLGLTQHKAAEKIGIMPTSLNNLLHGKHKPTLETALRIEAVTHGAVLPADWMVGV